MSEIDHTSGNELDATDKGSPEWCLAQINADGENAASDYHDGEDVLGVFGFEVTKRDGRLVLKATLSGTEDGVSAEHEWALTPIE